jgi:hypothetical protein
VAIRFSFYVAKVHGWEVFGDFAVVIVIALAGSTLPGKAHFDNGDVVLQADIV